MIWTGSSPKHINVAYTSRIESNVQVSTVDDTVDDDDNDVAVVDAPHRHGNNIKLLDYDNMLQINTTSTDRDAGDHLQCGRLPSTTLHHHLPSQRR